MSQVSAVHLALIARAFDVDPRDVREDTPLSMLGWNGSASDWLLAADHLGVSLQDDPSGWREAGTVGDVVAIVLVNGRAR